MSTAILAWVDFAYVAHIQVDLSRMPETELREVSIERVEGLVDAYMSEVQRRSKLAEGVGRYAKAA
jgi:hypothetical protein